MRLLRWREPTWFRSPWRIIPVERYVPFKFWSTSLTGNVLVHVGESPVMIGVSEFLDNLALDRTLVPPITLGIRS